MDPILEALISGPTILLAFLVYANLNQVNIKASRWLGTFILCVFLIQIDTLFQKTSYVSQDSFVSQILSMASLLIAPVFYFSVAYFTSPDRKWKWQYNFHFLFAGLILILILISQLVGSDKIETNRDKQIEKNIVLIFGILFCLMVTVYSVAAYIKIAKYQKKLFLYSSNVESVNLNWLKQVSVCVLILVFVWLADILFALSDSFIAYDYFSSLINFFGIGFIAFYSLKQKEVFPFDKQQKNEIVTIIYETFEADYNRKKVISDEKLAEMKVLLAALMEREKPYLDFELSLIKLATLLNTSPHLLSYTINTGFNENFYQFINRYRIQEAKQQMLDPKNNHLNLMGIAYEAGFNSKTVFNTVFKKMTGQTPSEFKRRESDKI